MNVSSLSTSSYAQMPNVNPGDLTQLQAELDDLEKQLVDENKSKTDDAKTKAAKIAEINLEIEQVQMEIQQAQAKSLGKNSAANHFEKNNPANQSSSSSSGIPGNGLNTVA